VGPTGGEILGLGDNLLPRESLDLEEVDLPLEPGDLIVELGEALFQWSVHP
jgi:hypothetical protein